jgi:hypothetical protein
MEPVFMLLAQSAATAAVFAIDDGIAVQEVDYEKLRERLIADGQRLEHVPQIRGVDPKTLPGIVIDDADAKLEGYWSPSTARQPLVGSHYLHDNNEGKGEKSATFQFSVEPGTYEVRLAYTADPNRATNVPVRIQTSNIASDFTLDQTKTPPIDNLFASVGTLRSSGNSLSVTISNAGTTGHVIVDAVQLIKK